MVFSIDAVEAKHGDSLILSYGEKSDPRFIVIDGGPRGVYNKNLKKKLFQLKNTYSQQKALPIELVILSHLDSDHITGLIDWTKDLINSKKNNEDLPFDILLLWYNTFDKIVGNNEVEIESSFLAGRSDSISFDSIKSRLTKDSELVMESVPQGINLDANADELDIPVNQGFKRLISATKSGKKVIDFGDDLEIIVVWPDEKSLSNLQSEWDKKIKELIKNKKLKETEMVSLAAYLDKSVYNLSSIVCLFKYKNKSMLLTGDARGDNILTGLENGKILPKNGEIKFDVLKLPHHGSCRDVEKKFFERVKADNYIISANGKYGNPDKETLEMLTEARGNEKYTIYFTNKTGQDKLETKLNNFFNSAGQKNKKYKVVFRKQTDLTVKIDLLDAT